MDDDTKPVNWKQGNKKGPAVTLDLRFRVPRTDQGQGLEEMFMTNTSEFTQEVHFLKVK